MTNGLDAVRPKNNRQIPITQDRRAITHETMIISINNKKNRSKLFPWETLWRIPVGFSQLCQVFDEPRAVLYHQAVQHGSVYFLPL